MKNVSVNLQSVAAVALALALTGCSTIGMLAEPDKVPALVPSYEIAGLSECAGNVPVLLDLSECVESAALSSTGFSGRPGIAGFFPIRKLVQREFNKVISVNFRTTLPDEHPKLVFEVRSERIQVSRSWSKVKSHMAFSVRIVDPVSVDRKPYFTRKYELDSEEMQKNKEEVPLCVYKDVQTLAKRFLDDIPRDQNGTLLTSLKELSAGNGN